jgi:phosphatidylglycerophosphate synthase
MDAAPIRDAVILPDDEDPYRPVAGVPLLVRTILALQRAGIERCTIVGGMPRPADPRIRCAVDTVSAVPAATDGALRLVIGPGAVVDEALVRDLQTRARAGEVLEVERAGARVRIAPGAHAGGRAGGAPMRPAAGTLLPANGDRAALEQSLLRALENPRDGYLDGLLHRRLSRPLTRVLLRTSISPNMITFAGVAVGMLGGLLIAFPGPVALAAGVACLVLSGVLDCSDGEVARLRFAESRLGHVLDVIGDTLVHFALLGGIVARAIRDGAPVGGGVVLALVLGALGAFAAITWSERTEERRRRVGGWENAVLDRVLSPLTTRDWYVFPLAFALAGRLDALVPAAAVGAHVFWIGVTVVLVRALARSRAQDQASVPRVRQ